MIILKTKLGSIVKDKAGLLWSQRFLCHSTSFPSSKGESGKADTENYIFYLEENYIKYIGG